METISDSEEIWDVWKPDTWHGDVPRSLAKVRSVTGESSSFNGGVVAMMIYGGKHVDMT